MIHDEKNGVVGYLYYALTTMGENLSVRKSNLHVEMIALIFSGVCLF